MANILIVDDSMLERKILSDIMTSLGHNVVGQAKNGEQAIEEYMRLKPDLVTTDLTMVGINGAEVISRIIAEDPEARIVVVSSHQERQVILDALERGARHFMVKPLSKQEVSTVVTNLLEQAFDKNKHHELINRIKNSSCTQEQKHRHHSARILIVDDSKLARQMLRDMLTALGHVVVGEAGNGTQAFVEYARLKPDAMTMDLTMQGLDGAASISKIMATHPDARIIVVSAIESRAAIIDALERGARHFIVKPIHQEKLAAVIQNVLEQEFDLQKHLNFLRKLKAVDDSQDLVEKTTPQYVPPYIINTQDDKLVQVTINPSLSLTSCQTLMTELAEHLDDKPRLLLDFGTMVSLDMPLFDQFNALVHAIVENKGIVRALSNRQEFVDGITSIQLDENTPNLLAKTLRYVEI